MRESGWRGRGDPGEHPGHPSGAKPGDHRTGLRAACASDTEITTDLLVSNNREITLFFDRDFGCSLSVGGLREGEALEGPDIALKIGKRQRLDHEDVGCIKVMKDRTHTAGLLVLTILATLVGFS